MEPPLSPPTKAMAFLGLGVIELVLGFGILSSLSDFDGSVRQTGNLGISALILILMGPICVVCGIVVLIRYRARRRKNRDA